MGTARIASEWRWRSVTCQPRSTAVYLALVDCYPYQELRRRVPVLAWYHELQGWQTHLPYYALVTHWMPIPEPPP